MQPSNTVKKPKWPKTEKKTENSYLKKIINTSNGNDCVHDISDTVRKHKPRAKTKTKQETFNHQKIISKTTVKIINGTINPKTKINIQLRQVA